MDTQLEAAATGEGAYTDVRAWMTHIALLKAQGYLRNVEFGDDEDSQQLVADAIEQNPDWEPGQVPRVPPRRLSAELHLPKATITRAMPRPRPLLVAPRPREHKPTATRRTTSRAGPDDPSEPEPPLAEIPPAEFRRQLDAALGGRA